MKHYVCPHCRQPYFGFKLMSDAIELTPTESYMLKVLLNAHPAGVRFTDMHCFSPRSRYTHMMRLRNKLQKHSVPLRIEVLRTEKMYIIRKEEAWNDFEDSFTQRSQTVHS